MRRTIGLLASIAAILGLLAAPARATTCEVGEPGAEDVVCVVYNDPVTKAVCTVAAKLKQPCVQ